MPRERQAIEPVSLEHSGDVNWGVTHLPIFLTLFLASQVILLELFVWGLTLLGPLLSLSTREKSESSLTNCMNDSIIIPLFTGELKAQSVD